MLANQRQDPGARLPSHLKTYLERSAGLSGGSVARFQQTPRATGEIETWAPTANRGKGAVKSCPTIQPTR